MTRRITQSVFFLGLATAWGVPALCQQPSVAPQLPGGVFAIAENTVGIAAEGGEVCAVGPAYRARFAGGGLEFTPALGSSAPRSYPLRFQLQSIRRGREVLYDAVASASAPAPLQDGLTVRYERGNGISEHYEIRAEGVKQSFVFASPPTGSGELVVRGRIETDLGRPVFVEDGGGGTRGNVRFLAGDLGGVRISAVLGVDADGSNARGATRLHGDCIDFVLPHEFVEGASYPLVLDPLISGELSIHSSTDRDLDPDIAYEETTGYLAVWERALSSGDVDILGQRMTATGGAVGGLIMIETSSRVTLNPTVASVDVGNGYFVAWQDGPSPFGPWDVRGRTVTSTSALSPIADLAVDPTFNETDPDIGGMVSTTDDKALVVWQQDGPSAGIRTRYVDVQGTGTALLGGPITLSGSPLSRNPAISKTSGSVDRFLVVWEQEIGAGIGIHAVSTTINGNVLSGPFTVTSGAVATAPAVDGNGVFFLIAYEKEESPGSVERDIMCQRLIVDRAGVISGSVAETAVEAASNDDQMQPAVSYLGAKYAVAWADEEIGVSYHIRLRALDPTTCQPCGPLLQVSSFFPVNHLPEIASRYSGESGSAFLGSSSLDQALVLYQAGDDAPPFDTTIRGRRYEAIGGGGLVQTLGAGCGSGGAISAFGPVAVGNSAFEFRLAGADPASLIYAIGFALPGTPLLPPCGSCTVVNGSFNFVVPSGTPGTASFRLPIPCSPGLVGLQVDAQWIAFGTAANPCPTAATLSASNRIRVTVGL